MHTASILEEPAFRELRRRLTRRRLSQLDLPLKLELALITLLITAFVFWQVRGSFASFFAQGGSRAVLLALSATWLVLTAIAMGVVAWRHARRLRSGAPGPPWLALPVSERALGRHLAWDSRLVTGWIAVPTAGIWLAALGLVPPLVELSLVPAMGLTLIAACRLGSALGERLAVGRAGARGPRRLAIVLATAESPLHTHRMRPAHWTRRAMWRALAFKDLRVTTRIGSVRRHLAIALVLWLLSLLAWRLPAPPHMTDLDYVAAFLLALLGSAAVGEWLISLSGADPFQALRVLPIGVGDLWSARFALAFVGAALLLAAHTFSAVGLSPHALRLFLAWQGGATLMIAALAVNYGVTLFPRADVAERLFGLSLLLAVAASLMIPLLGWIVLLSAVLHSARRLAHWARLEET